MGIFDFFKKIAKEENEEVEIERISFAEIGDWINKKIKENESKEKEVIVVVKQRVEDFIKDLGEKIIILQGIDIASKREKDKIKNVVIDSREQYIDSVEDLIEKLHNLEETKLENFIEKINKIFFDFNKSSSKNYERTTILIGKEMADIKNSLKTFSQDLLKTFNENQFVIEGFNDLEMIKTKLNLIESLDKIIASIEKNKLELLEKIDRKQGKHKTFKQDLEEMKKSQNYLENLERQKKIEILKEESKNHILELKQLINFKILANFFHINPDQMIILKNHKEDFQTHFIKDNGKSIMDLLDESKLKTPKIMEKMQFIFFKMEEIKKHEQELKPDETGKLSETIQEILKEIDLLKIEQVKEEKRDEKLRLDKRQIIQLLKEELNRMNVEVI